MVPPSRVPLREGVVFPILVHATLGLAEKSVFFIANLNYETVEQSFLSKSSYLSHKLRGVRVKGQLVHSRFPNSNLKVFKF